MTGTDAMRSVVVVGGGITAWTAAAALKRHIPTLAVTVVDCGVPANALADGMICTLPSIGGFHADLGLGTGDTVARVASGLRIGTMFEGSLRMTRHPEGASATRDRYPTKAVEQPRKKAIPRFARDDGG